MLMARALVRTGFLNVGNEPDRILDEFRIRFYDTELFFDKYAKGKFGRYLLDRHEDPPQNHSRETAYRAIEEARLFIEACHECEARVSSGAVIS
jgi:sulfite reductase (ferredoxin)